MLSLALAAALAGVVSAQRPIGEEVHPKLTTYRCTKADGCVSQDTSIVLDSLSRPLYQVNAPEYDCGTVGPGVNTTACPDAETCFENCVMEGIQDYTPFGVVAEGDAVTLDMLRDSDLEALFPRIYLLSEDDETYEMLQLVGQEFTFDVDVSKLPCGMNGALYLSEMEAEGGKSELNPGGAAYGTGYCDAQCYFPPFNQGVANIRHLGACCNEMDIWEANSRATTFVPHPCNVTGFVECEGAECEREGICDKPGCGYNNHRVGHWDFYGRANMTIDTKKPFTVVTKFPADKCGKLKSIHRQYVQNGVVIDNPVVNIEEHPDYPEINYINDEFCEAAGAEPMLRLGGTVGMGRALSRGMVLAMSVWWDAGGYMNWLDQNESGPCNATEGSPESIREVEPGTQVTFSNIRWGEIDSTV
jgi:cellulase